MEKYSQDFGFYCKKEPLSLVAGKILTALHSSHTANISEIPSNNRFSIGDYVTNDKECEGTEARYSIFRSGNPARITQLGPKIPTASPQLSAVTALLEKNEIASLSVTTSVSTGSVINQDRIQLLAAPLVTQDEPIQKPGTNISVLDDISYEKPTCATRKLKCSVSPKPKLCILEKKVTRKLSGKQHNIVKSDEIQLYNIWSMSLEQQCTLLEDSNKTKAIILTMVFQKGSSLLYPPKDSNTLLSGILILVKRHSDVESVNPSESNIYDKEDIYIFMDITDTALLRENQEQYNFLRKVLLLILQRKTPVICFNAKDLLRTIVRIYGNWKKVSQCVIFDPRIAAWLLNPSDCNLSFEELVKIHCERVDLKTTYNSSHTQSEELWDLFCTIELPLTTILAVMENNTIQVNEEELKKTSVLLGIHLKELEREAHHAAGEKFRLTSSNELRQVLFEKLNLHLRCKSKLPRTSSCHLPSTAEPTLHQLEDLHPLPRIILQFRQVQKIKSTFVDGLSSYISKGCVSPTWNQTGTVSGRLSAKHPNIQGVSKLSIQFEKKQYVQGKAKEIVTINPRSMFISAKGHTFLAADFSQIELRLLAHFSSDPELLQLFNKMETTDIFTSMASQWKNVEYKNITQADREQAKRVVYSVIYGVGKERLSQCLGTTRAEANAFMEHFLQKYSVSDFTQKVIDQCHRKGLVVSLMGRKRPLPHINSKNYSLRAQAERQAVNFVIQGSAADLCKLAMITISSSITSSSSLTPRIIAQIHDELLFEVEDSQIQEFAALVKHIMESLQHASGVGLKVPLKVTLSCGKSWGCMTEHQVK
ncbi:DNA polymerase nu isoform X2 [Pseudophryne corroboree]|uniref:DNA polymerase nu isoform X2 n=1 Tax=Pseudophryne corroboree TaxID=495146 RepID=UPI003081DF23